MTVPILSVRDLTVELPVEGKWCAAVERVSFDVAPGEALGIVGETGCGKTLLGRALINLPPEGARISGSIVCGGQDLSSAPEKEWTRIRGGRIAMVFQEPAAALDPVQTIGSQLLESVRRHRGASGAAARGIAADLLAEVSFPDPRRGLSEYPHRLSGGLKQRALIAIALAGDPEVLIADEPTTALDATVSADVLELLDRLRRGRGLALALITHDLASVARHTDRTLVLYAGRIVEDRPTGDLFGAPMHPYTRGLLDCLPRIGTARTGRWPAIPGTVPDLASRPAGGCAFAPRCPDRFEACELSVPPLFPLAAGAARCFLYQSQSQSQSPVPAGVPEDRA